MSLTLKIIGKNYFLLNQYNLHFDNIFTINITYKANIFKVSVIIFNVYIAQFLYNQNLFHEKSPNILHLSKAFIQSQLTSLIFFSFCLNIYTPFFSLRFY